MNGGRATGIALSGAMYGVLCFSGPCKHTNADRRRLRARITDNGTVSTK